MPLPTFDAFRDEILAIQIYFTSHQNKTVRNEQLRERIRNAYRTWSFVVLQELTPYLQNKNPSLKLTAELEALAKLTSKIKPVSDYRKRLRRSIQLLNSLVIYLPISTEIIREARHLSGADLFIPSIPDLPSRFVPNALLGWKS